MAEILIIGDFTIVADLADKLQLHLKSKCIVAVSPTGTESLQEFVSRILRENPLVVVIYAEMAWSGLSESSVPGLTILELLLGRRALPAVVLSFAKDPVALSRKDRLTDPSGQPFLSHSTILHCRRPENMGVLAERVRVASQAAMLLEPERTVLISKALRERVAATLSHKYSNLRACIRMLRGVGELALLSREEYTEILEALQQHHPTARVELLELGQLAHEAEAEWTSVKPLEVASTKRVLLIDDEAESCAWRSILAPLCRTVGAELFAEISLNRAEQRLRENPPDAILLDLHFLGFESAPNPFEVVATIRETSPTVPIIIFTTETEGRYVRDLSQNAFYYFFKEFREETAANTRMYAESFREVVQAAIARTLPVSLRSLVRLAIPLQQKEDLRFEPARNLLESAATAILRSEVSLSLTSGAILEARIAIADPKLGVTWTHIKNLFNRSHRTGLRRNLPAVVQALRNSASHYEDPRQPTSHSYDATIYLLVAAQFITDLRELSGLMPRSTSDSRQKVLGVLSRIVTEISQQTPSPLILDDQLKNAMRDLGKCPTELLQQLLEERWIRASKAGRIQATKAGFTYSGFSNAVAEWLGELPSLPAFSWSEGSDVAPYFLYASTVLFLERISQLSAEDWQCISAERDWTRPGRMPDYDKSAN